MAEESWEEEFDPDMDAETFILQYELDDHAAAALRSSPEEAVRSVISQGPPSGHNNSALIMSRLRQVNEGTDQDWDTFISMVDDKAKEVFLAQSEEVMQAVMEQGPLVGTNPSAILMARIRKAGGTQQGSCRRVAKRSNLPTVSATAAGQGVVRGGRQPHGSALQGLGQALCKLSSDMWNFDVPAATLVATFKNVLKSRVAAVAAAQMTTVAAVLPVSDEWPEWPEASAEDISSEPRKKKARQAGSVAATGHQQAMDIQISDDDREQRREAVLAEVVRMVKEAGGSMPLQDIGSPQLTELRKGAVANISKFLSSRPDMVKVSNEGNGRSPTVSLAASGPMWLY